MKTKITHLFIMILAVFMLPSIVSGQTQVGTGASPQQIPIVGNYGYTYSQQIYLASEILSSGTITQLKFDFTGTDLSTSNDWTIYIGHTSKTSFSSTTDWIPTTAMTQVYSAVFADPGAPGWITFDITDWAYNGTDNIVVAVDENASGYDGYADKFNATSTSSNRTIYYRSDSNNPNPLSPPTASGNISYIPNIIFDGIAPPPPPPTALNETAVTATGATLGWTSGGATLYNVEHGTAGFTRGTGTYASITTNSLVVTGLSAGTAYDWYVQDSISAGNVSPWASSSFTTAYIPNYAEDFATYTPTHWTEATGFLSQNAVLTGSSSLWTSDGFANDGTSGAARMEIWSTGKKEWLISPSIDLSGGNNHFLAFDVALTYYNTTAASTFGADDTLAVVISTDNGATWSLANALQIWDAGSEPSNTGDHIIINLPAATYSSAVKIGFYAASSVSGGDINVYIDNFEVNVLTLDEVEVAEVIGNYGSIDQGNFTVKAIVKNNGNAPQSNITLNYLLEGGSVVSQSGFALASYAIDTFTFTTQLSGSATADSLILSVYSTLSGDENINNDTAYAEVITWDIPYNIGFEAETSTEVPSSWSQFNTYSSAYAYAYESSSSAFEGTKSLKMYNNSSTSDSLIAILPSYEGTSLSDKWFSFQAKASTSGTTVIIGVMTDPADATTFEAIETKTLTDSYAEYIVKLDTYTGSGKHLAFWHGNEATYRSIYLDNVSLFIPPQNDAAITAFNPITLSGSQNVIVDLKNAGALTLSSVNIYYSIDGGTAVGPFVWTGTLAKASTLSGLNIGTHNFDQADAEIEVWTALPNGLADEDTSNDTLTASIDITTDGGILTMDETSIMYGSSPVNAYLANFGSDILTTSTIGWSVNGVVQTSATWNGSITNGNAGGPINLGNYNFDIDTHIVKIWTVAPNGISTADDDNTNDTLENTFIFNIDAGISQIDVPTEAGTQDIIVYIENYNNVPLTSATINYSVNGGADVVYNWTGNIAPGDTEGPITIGTGTFTYGSDTIIASTMSPNGATDIDGSNDTLKEIFIITTDLALIDGGVNPMANCNRGIDTLFVEIQNNGTADITGPFNVSYKEGTSTVVTEAFATTDTIMAGGSFVYTFNTLVNLAVSADSSFEFKAWVDMTDDSDASNDTISGNIDSWITPADPTVTGATVAYGNTATLGAVSANNDSLVWYDSQIDGSLLGYGTTYTTPALLDTTTYYVASQAMDARLQVQDLTKTPEGTSSTSFVPAYGNWDYNWSRFIYTPTELGLSNSGVISKIAFQQGNTTSNYVMPNQKIYLMHTTDNTILSNAYLDPVAAGATLVYDASITFDGGSGSWQEIVLQTTFNYNNTDNLLVIYENRDGAYGGTYPSWKYSSTTDRVAYKYADNSFPAVDGTISYYLPNIKLTASLVALTPHCQSNRIPVVANVTGIPSDAGITNINEVTETGSQDIFVELSNFTSVVLNTVDIDFEVNGVAGTTFSWTGSLAKDSTEIVNIGTGTFVHGKDTIKAWSSNPNGSVDPNALNDTLEIGFTIYSDIELISVTAPIVDCGLGNTTVSALITNLGDDTIHTFDMAYHVLGENDAVIETVNTYLAPKDTLLYQFSTNVDLTISQDSLFELWFYSVLATDSTDNNDSAFYKILSRPVTPSPTVENDTVSYGTTAQLDATNSGYSQYWYSNLSSNTELLIGDEYNTPVLYDTTTYYVESKSTPYSLNDSTTIGTGNTINQGIPIEPYFGYTYSQSIYLASEITQKGLITELRYYYEGGTLSNNLDWKIYIGTTSKTQFTSSTDWVPLNELTEVFDAQITDPGAGHDGWITIDISDYAYLVNENIVIAVEENQPSYNGSGDEFHCTSASSRSIQYQSDSNNPDPANPPSGTIKNYYPNIQLNIVAPETSACISPRVPVTAVVNNFPAKDAAIVSINTPNDGINLTNTEAINISVKNNGTVAIDTIPVHYMLDAAAAVVDTLFATILPGATADFTFATTIDLSAVAVYSLEVTTAVTGDVITANDAITKSIQQGDYCISKALYTTNNDIGNVTIKHPVTNAELLNNGIALPVLNNVLANKLYTDYTTLAPIDVEIGQAYPISISQIEIDGSFRNSTIKVYIDVNQDGDFDDAFELAAEGTTTGANTNIALDTFMIPQNALVGNTRMRIVLDESDVANACGTYTWGETEDYTINIVEQVIADAGMNDTICNTFGTTLVGSGLGTGLSYAWSTGDNTTMTTVTPTTTTMYYFSVTDTYGFTATDSAEVFVRDLPSLTFPALSDMCVDANAITLTATPAGGTYYGAGVTGNIFNPTTAGAGTHTLKYIYTNMYGCTDSITTTQFVNELPNITATSAAVNNIVPYNTATTLDATVSNAMGALTYDWSPTASINGDTAVQMPATIDILFATSYVVEIIDAGTSCKNTDTVDITYSGGPVSVSPISIPASICAGDTAILRAQSAGGNGTITYSWTSNPVGFTSTDKNPKVMPTQNTSYIVEATDGVNIAIDTVDVTILADPIITYSMDTTFVCLGSQGEAIVELTGLAPFSYTYNGIMTNATANRDTIVTAALNAEATYYVTSVTDANGCSSAGDLDSLQFMINDLPTVVYTGSDTICIGGNTTATATFTGATPFDYIYNGTAVNGVNAMSDNQIITPTMDSMFMVTKVTDGNGCISMGNLDSIYVKVNPLPTAIASDNDSICLGDSTIISINFTGTAPYTFNVWNGTAMMSDLPSATDVFTTYDNSTVATTYTIKSITDANGCVLTGDIDSLEIFVNSLPAAPSFTGLAADYCEDAAVVTLSGLPTGGVFSGNGIIGNDFDPSTAVSGSNDIEYRIADANGCENFIVNSTTINVLPTIVISGLATDYCVDAADVSLTATPAGTGSVWSGTATATGDFSPVTNGVGTHNVVYTFTDANGCVNSDTATTMVNALPVVTLTTLADVCDETNNFMITGGMPAGGDWSGNGVLSNYFDATTAGAGAHYLTYTFTDSNGCVNFDSTMQTVIALPVLNITGLDAAYCANAATSTLTATPAGGTFFGTGMTANVFDPSMVAAGSVSVLYSYTDAITGCFNSESATTIVNAIPMIDLGSDNIVCVNNNSTLDAGNAGATFLWSTGATTQTIVIDTNGFGVGSFMYDVLVTDANMCTNMDSVEITYEALPVSQLTDTNTICGQNSDITLDAGYISGNTYVWSNGVSWSSITINSTDLGGYTGNMSVVITSDAGCVTNDETYVYFRENPVVDLGGDDIVCINHEFTIDAGAGFASYLWNTGATTQAITIDSNTFDVGQNMLKVEVYNDVNCSAMDSMILVVDPCTGVEMPELTNADINIYPNPTKGQFQIDVVGLENEEYNLDIYNSVGAVVYSDKVSNDGNSKQTWKLDFSTYAKGVYYVRLHSNGDIKVKRIIIN